MLSSKLSLFGSLLAVVASAQNLTITDLSSGATCACAKLAESYASQLITTNSTDYTTEATGYWDVRADLLPKCIFMPTVDTQVADAVSIFTSCGAQFAVRGGGHMNVNTTLPVIMRKFLLTDDTVSWFQQY